MDSFAEANQSTGFGAGKQSQENTINTATGAIV